MQAENLRSPYRQDEVRPVKTAATLFGGYAPVVLPKKRASERGELLEYFSKKLGLPIPRFVWKLSGLKLADLYFIRSAADSYERDGKGKWGKAFNGMLKPKK